MTFEEWADRTFGIAFKDDEPITYFRMSAAWEKAQKELRAELAMEALKRWEIGNDQYKELIAASKDPTKQIRMKPDGSWFSNVDAESFALPPDYYEIRDKPNEKRDCVSGN